MNKKSLQQIFTRKVLPPNIEIKTLYKKASVFENHESNLLLAGNTEWKQVYFTCYSGERCGPWAAISVQSPKPLSTGQKFIV